MFTFDDLVKLDGPAVQVLLRNVDNAKLGLALKGAKEELRELFLKNMSERAAKILREDMENLGPVRLRDVEDAQGEIVGMAKGLMDRGEIAIASNNDEDMIS
jgi:flagellar motor switch protein FliG